MGRTYRDSQRWKLRHWWDEWLYLYYYRNIPRDALVELNHLEQPYRWEGGRFYTEWRKACRQRERALIHMSLKHGGLYWYYRRKDGDGYWD